MSDRQQKLREIEIALKGARRISYGLRYGGLALLDKEIVKAQAALEWLKAQIQPHQLEMEV